MNTRVELRALAAAIARRSTCAVQVGAVLSDAVGPFAWGWNHAGRDGRGECAERHLIKRANAARLSGATLTVVAYRKKSGRMVCSRPCPACEAHVASKVRVVEYYQPGEGWQMWSIR